MRLVALLTICLSVLGADISSDFDAANRLYEKYFAGSIAAYQQMIANGRASAPLLFNLGNAYFKTARLAAPSPRIGRRNSCARDPDLRGESAFCAQQCARQQRARDAAGSAFASVTLNELAFISALGCGHGSACWRLATSSNAKASLRTSVVGSGIIAVAMTAWFAVGLIRHSTDRIAVVVVPTSAVRLVRSMNRRFPSTPARPLNSR